MFIAIEGILAGIGHVITGPDHLVGVAPLAADRSKRIRPAVVGATWGLGHGLGVAVLGVLGQTLLSAADVEIASIWAERLVGLILIVMGLIAIKRARSVVIHEHVHRHGGEEHVHLHVHGHGNGGHGRNVSAGPTQGTELANGHAGGHGHGHAAFGIGVVHGLAGAGHFWAVLPSLAMGRAEAAVYIAGYIGASIVIMTAFGAFLGRVSSALGLGWLPRFLTGVGAITVAIGVFWAAQSFGLLG